MKKSREYRIVRIRIKRTKRLPAFLTALTKNKIALHHLTTTDNEVSFHTIRNIYQL